MTQDHEFTHRRGGVPPLPPSLEEMAAAADLEPIFELDAEQTFGPDDMRIEVTVRFTTGDGELDEMTETVSLPGIFKPENLESSEARVAEAIGEELIEPIRARMRAEILFRCDRLPEAWLEDDPILIDWYREIRLAGSRSKRVRDMAQWFRVVQGRRAGEYALKFQADQR